ncbi:MAG: ComEC/Rec2 family competence protein [Actinomycetes bacterium]
MRYLLLLALALAAPPIQPAQSQPEKPLEVYFIDVEGGQATLFVTPAGQSMLIDTGFPGNQDRDIKRILATMKQAGVSRLDYLLVTHFHLDHVGNAAALAAKVPVGTFVDHGETVEANSQELLAPYYAARKSGKHLQVKPDDKVPVDGMDVTVVSAGGAHLSKPLDGADSANTFCGAFTPKETDPSENAQSLGTVIAFGRFRMLDLGDLTWNKEHDLVCPLNLIGPVDLYLTTHHGVAQSNAPVIVNAVQPRVAIMNNGTSKGGAPEAWQIIHDSPRLQDFWQLHYAVAGGKQHNTAEPFIANLDESTAHNIKVTARRDGSFTVTNTRNGMTKTYTAATSGRAGP